MRKILLTLAIFIGIIGAAQAQKVTSRVVDNKGTIKWVIDSSTSVIINAKNGVTKSGDTLKLGGALTETTTIATSATQFLQLTGLQSGSRTDSVLMINNITGQIKKMSVADLVSNYANNGLSKNGDTVQLGGSLNKATSISTTATNTLAISGLQSGSTNDSVVVADATTGVLKRISLKDAVKANNGVSKNGDTVQLGGALTKATSVTTTATNTLAISGLQSGSSNDSVVVADATTGVLKRISLANAVKANNGVSKSGDTVQLGGSLTKATTVTTTATNTLAIQGLQTGAATDSILTVDPTTGVIKRRSLANAVKANNGVSKNGDTVQLGGALTKATSVTTTATNTLAISGLQSGSSNDSVVVADATTGVLKRISLANAVKANNGVSKSGDTVQLGGSLTKATTVTTTATNTLAIAGLQSGSSASDSLVVADATTGALKRISASTLITSGDQVFTATAGLTTYTVTNLPAQVSRVWVFRNGVKLIATTDYTVSGSTVTLNPGGVAPDDWAVLAGDKIEVQWFK